MHYHAKDIVLCQIAKNGLVRDYEIWRSHREIQMLTPEYHNYVDIQYDQSRYHNMVTGVAASLFNMQDIEKLSNLEAQQLYDRLLQIKSYGLVKV